jgi:hypothetical protein
MAADEQGGTVICRPHFAPAARDRVHGGPSACVRLRRQRRSPRELCQRPSPCLETVPCDFAPNEFRSGFRRFLRVPRHVWLSSAAQRESRREDWRWAGFLRGQIGCKPDVSGIPLATCGMTVPSSALRPVSRGDIGDEALSPKSTITEQPDQDQRCPIPGSWGQKRPPSGEGLQLPNVGTDGSSFQNM